MTKIRDLPPLPPPRVPPPRVPPRRESVVQSRSDSAEIEVRAVEFQREAPTGATNETFVMFQALARAYDVLSEPSRVDALEILHLMANMTPEGRRLVLALSRAAGDR